MQSSGRVGASNFSWHSTNGTPHSCRRERLVPQSGDSLCLGFMSHIFTVSPCAASIRATARPSPPLFPGPANIANNIPFPPKRPLIASVSLCAARSMRSIDAIGSYLMVAASMLFICAVLNIFIPLLQLHNYAFPNFFSILSTTACGSICIQRKSP